jgi:DNA-binding MarR family transcriptional regulator
VKEAHGGVGAQGFSHSIRSGLNLIKNGCCLVGTFLQITTRSVHTGRLRGLRRETCTVSRQDKLDLPSIDNVLPDILADDDQLQISIRLGLDEVAAAEEERLRVAPRRRPTRNQLGRLAFDLYKARRDREAIFRQRLLGEPAWDMLLALYAFPRRGEVVTVSSLSNLAQVPEATGLRWQSKLMEDGLIRRGPHIVDRRIVLVGLTDRGRLLMDQYLTRLFQCQAGPDLRE